MLVNFDSLKTILNGIKTYVVRDTELSEALTEIKNVDFRYADEEREAKPRKENNYG